MNRFWTETLRDRSDAELNAAASLAACVLIWAFLAMRLTDGGLPVDAPLRHLLWTYVIVVVAMIAATAAISSALVVRRVREKRIDEVERDERDLQIEARAERVEGWVAIAGINVLVVHAIASQAAGNAHALVPVPTLSSPPTLVFALLTVAFAAYGAKQVATLWLYRR